MSDESEALERLVNRVIGLGVDSPASEPSVREIVAAYGAADIER